MLDTVGETQVSQETREVLLGSQDTGENNIRLSSPGRRGRSRYKGHDPRGEEIQEIQDRQGILLPESLRGGAPTLPVEPGAASLDTRRGENAPSDGRPGVVACPARSHSLWTKSGGKSRGRGTNTHASSRTRGGTGSNTCFGWPPPLHRTTKPRPSR